MQRDYQLKLRLGYGFNFDELQADLRDDVLTIVVPKRASSLGQSTQRPNSSPDRQADSPLSPA